MGYPITCAECDGKKGWSSIDGFWVECDLCGGKGWYDEDTVDPDEDDEC